MGIYTDYGRFQKAREFKNYCNSDAGIWFGFGLGSPRWDDLVEDSNGNLVPNCPPSAPNPYSPVYRNFVSYKGSSLVQQEFALIDRSFTYDQLDPSIIPTDQEIIDNADTYPQEEYEPCIIPFDGTAQYWLDQYKESPNSYFPTSALPMFPVAYQHDWDSYITNYDSSVQPEPIDPSQFESYSYNLHLQEGYDCTLPVGLLAFIQGSAVFVEPIEGEPSGSPSESLRTFKYGAHYWRIVPDSEITYNKLPHHVLLTVSVFPNELHNSAVVEQSLCVRQVSVWKFPTSIYQDRPELDPTSQNPVPRSSQVVQRKDLNIQRTDPSTGVETPHISGKFNLPINCMRPLNPNDSEHPTAEMLINDYMTARKRDVQQTDRYGYIIGF